MPKEQKVITLKYSHAWPELKEALKMPWYKLLCSSFAE
jgi:hypothetical protein